MEVATLRKIDTSDHTGIQLHIKQEPQNEFDSSDDEIIQTMELVPLRKIDATDRTAIQLHVKQEPQNEFDNEPVVSVMESNSSFRRIKIELESDEEIIEIPSQTIRKEQRTDKQGNKNAPRNDKIGGKNGRHELTQLPCIVNIKSSAVLEKHSQRPHNGTLDISNGISNSTSLQSSIQCESISLVSLNEAAEHNDSNNNCESNGHVALNEAAEQNSSNNNFTTKVYEMLVGIQSTLKDLKAEIADNSKRIDQLQKCLPQPWSYTSSKNEFNFPLSTEEQLLELEKKLENNEMATKLIIHLTSRTFSSWKEMILLCLKYMMSGDVAVLYNLNGVKGTKKKFRDLNICNILVESVMHKFKEATGLEILKRISLTLAGARDWQRPRYKRKKFF